MKRTALMLSCIVMAMVGGCVRQVLMVDEPPWHSQPSGVYSTLDGKRFYGVGRAAGIQNTTLLKATAGNAARKEMGLVLRQYVTALVGEATLQIGGPDLSPEDLDQLRGLLIRNAVRRAVISDHWTPGPSRLLALCELDLETLKRILVDDNLPQAEMRQAMWDVADQVHTRLSGQFQSN